MQATTFRVVDFENHLTKPCVRPTAKTIENETQQYRTCFASSTVAIKTGGAEDCLRRKQHHVLQYILLLLLEARIEVMRQA